MCEPGYLDFEQTKMNGFIQGVYEKSGQEVSSHLYDIGFFVLRLSDVHLEDNGALQETKGGS